MLRHENKPVSKAAIKGAETKLSGGAVWCTPIAFPQSSRFTSAAMVAMADGMWSPPATPAKNIRIRTARIELAK